MFWGVFERREYRATRLINIPECCRSLAHKLWMMATPLDASDALFVKSDKGTWLMVYFSTSQCAIYQYHSDEHTW